MTGLQRGPQCGLQRGLDRKEISPPCDQVSCCITCGTSDPMDIVLNALGFTFISKALYVALTAHYSLFTTHYLLLTAHYSLLTTHYSLLIAHCSLLTIHYSLLPLNTEHSLPTASGVHLPRHSHRPLARSRFNRGRGGGDKGHLWLHSARRTHLGAYCCELSALLGDLPDPTACTPACWASSGAEP